MDKIIIIIEMIIAAIGNCPAAKGMSDQDLVAAVQKPTKRDLVRLFLALGQDGVRGSKRRKCMSFVINDGPTFDPTDAADLVAEARANMEA
jgi:hypothetical protein